MILMMIIVGIMVRNPMTIIKMITTFLALHFIRKPTVLLFPRVLISLIVSFVISRPDREKNGGSFQVCRYAIL